MVISWRAIDINKVGMEETPVFWNLLEYIPKGIMDRIRKLCFNLLWRGSVEYKGLHLVSWKKIVLPK
jgi:hypothetical protein